MKKRNPSILIATLAVVLLSSCNRGYGCPNNFSLDLNDVIQTVVAIFPF